MTGDLSRPLPLICDTMAEKIVPSSPGGGCSKRSIAVWGLPVELLAFCREALRCSGVRELLLLYCYRCYPRCIVCCHCQERRNGGPSTCSSLHTRF
jgi:hypothetical protein